MTFDMASALRVALLVLSLGTPGAHAHEGHDHGNEPPPAPAAVQPRGEAQSDHFELLVTAQGAELVIYLDRFITNEPVPNATIEVETPSGPTTAAPRDGAYRLPAAWLSNGGSFELVMTVTLGETIDILPVTLVVPSTAAQSPQSVSERTWFARLGTLSTAPMIGAGIAGFILGVLAMSFRRRPPAIAALAGAALLVAATHADAHEGHDHGPPKAAVQASGDQAVRQADGIVFVPKPLQRIFAIRTVMTENGKFRRSVELPGRIIPDPDASGYVQASVGGRIGPPPNGFPRLGARVRKGDILAYVTPPLQAIDVSDMRQRQGELDQQIAIVERRLKRFETLAPSGAVARSQLEETRLELDGLRDRRAALESQRREPEALVAPVDGVVADGTPVAGQIVQSNAVVFHIVEPSKLWVEALSFQALGKAANASARTASGATLTLAFRGAGFADRSQSVPVHFAIESDRGGLRPGEFVSVYAQTGEPVSGLVLPRTAAVRAANGQHFVFEHVTAERFEPKPVRIEPLDAARVLVLDGIGRGRRIVVQGAELLDQVR
jgi:membrane fusion protein, heavy metal efflux system